MFTFQKGNKITLGALNCQGLKDKVDQPIFTDLINKMDIMGVCETWLNTETAKDIFLPGYNFYPFNRKKTEGAVRGGIGIFLKKELKKYVKIRSDLSCENFMWCKVKKEYLGYHDDLYICVVYIPPEYSTREIREKKDHFKTLKETTSKIDSKNIILLGDFNSRTQTLEDTLTKTKGDDSLPIQFYSKVTSKRSNQDLMKNKYGQKLIEYCISTGLYIANGRTLGDLQGKMTCFQTNGSSTVDYGIVSENMNRNILKFQVLDPTASDHSPIQMVIESANKKNKKQNTDTLAPSIKWNEKTEMILNHKLNSEETAQTIKEIDHLLDRNENMDVIVEKLNNIYDIQNTKNKTKKKGRNIPKQRKKWYDKTCEEMAKELKLNAKLLTLTPNSPFLRGSLYKKRKEYKKLVKSKKREWRATMIKKLEEIENTDPKEYWKIINELREKKTNEVDFDTEKFTTFFERLYSLPKTTVGQQEITDYVLEALNDIPQSVLDADFTLEELVKAIRQLKNNKAAGPDRIIAEVLKASTETILIIILKIMNKIKTTLDYPSTWANGITSLLYKDGDDDDPNNYRAITVTDAFAKVLAILLNERIEVWSKENNIIKPEQIGFEKKARPADHLFVLKTITDKYKSEGKKIYTCFIDFQKAFDSVWRTGLLYKLIKSGLNLNTIKLIKNMYEKTKQTLKMNGGTSRCFRTYKGVKQGCILSPKLFNLFINDIPNIFDQSCRPVTIHGGVKINCLMYADDLVIMSETASGLQACLNKLHEYTNKWGLTLNIKKTKIMIFQSRGKRAMELFTFGNQVVQQADEYKYLGTIITNSGSFKRNETNLKKKGLRASYLVSQNIGQDAKPSTSIGIFEKVVEPILLYNCEITGTCIPTTWNIEKFKKNMWEIGKEINKVVIGFLRQILGVHKKTTNIAVLSETGKFPISLKMFKHIIRYWRRIATSEKILLVAAREANEMMQKKNKHNCSKVTNYLLNMTGSTIDTNQKTIEKELENLYIKWWTEQAKTTGENKLDYYYTLKRSFGFEKYLNNVPPHIRRYITRLRMSSHAFPIEVQRYNKKKIQREDRKCTICNLNEVGNEEHYLLRCKNAEIENIRHKFTTEIRKTIPQLLEFSNKNIIDYGMILHDQRIQIPMATYVKQVMEMYKEETEDTKEIIKPPIKTRTGRLVKKPVKLDL